MRKLISFVMAAAAGHLEHTWPGKELRGLQAKSSAFMAMMRSSGMPSFFMEW